MDGLDILIIRSLHSRWGYAEPSPRVWRRIARRIASLASRLASEEHLNYYPPSRRPESTFPFSLASASGLILWRYDPMLMQLV